jgi:RNA polymerase sigma-70 factor (family 1)
MDNKQPSVCEEATFQGVFREYAEGLRNFLYYRCGHLPQAEDWVQESFVRLWKNCAKVPLPKVKGFLYTVANNLFLNEVKHQQVVLSFRQQQPRTGQDTLTPQVILEGEEFKARLTAAIADLPEGQRTVFLLNRTEQKTYKEIAELLGISVKAVEKRMHKALLNLRQVAREGE